MNVVDYIIIGILALSVIYGIYRGFLQTLLSVASFFLAVFLAFQFGPTLSGFLREKTGLSTTLKTYTDTVARVGDAELSNRTVLGLDPAAIERVMDSVRLPEAVKSVVRKALESDSYRTDGLDTVNEYVQRTVVDTVLDILCYLICFAAASILLGIIVSLIKHVFRFPVLRAMDGLAGGVFGLVRGAVIVYALFLLVPLMETMLPDQGIQALVDASRLASVFQNDGFFIRVVNSL